MQRQKSKGYDVSCEVAGWDEFLGQFSLVLQVLSANRHSAFDRPFLQVLLQLLESDYTQ